MPGLFCHTGVYICLSNCLCPFVYLFVVVHSPSHVCLFETPWTVACQASLSFTMSQNLLNSCSLNQWCQPTILPSVAPFSSCLHFLPASGSFPISWLFVSDHQSIGASASASVLPMNVQGWFPLRLSGFISCCPKDSLESSSALHSKASILQCSAFFYCPALTSIHGYWKNHGFDYKDCYWQSDVSAF